MSLIEITVAMSIMGIFLAMATPLFLRLYGTEDATELTSAAQSQVNTAFLRLDAEIRYATAISAPGQLGLDWYVEYVTNPAGTLTCTELRLTAAGEFQRRSWPLGSHPTNPFTVLVAGLDAGGPTVPFSLVNPGSSTIVQRLAITLKAAGSPSFDVNFAALNSGSAGSNVASCVTDGRS
jgi:type II secretory pathway pseudopilin PulG